MELADVTRFIIIVINYIKICKIYAYFLNVPLLVHWHFVSKGKYCNVHNA